jgi:hypothetical protein
MPKGWSVNWENMARTGGRNLETRWRESLLVVYMCVSVLCLVDAKSSPSGPKELMTTTIICQTKVGGPRSIRGRAHHYGCNWTRTTKEEKTRQGSQK